MTNEDWAKIAKELTRLPEGQRMFATRFFQSLTSDTKKPCGCALGQIAFNLSGAYDRAPFLGNLLGLAGLHAADVYIINDTFRHDDDTEAACRERYAHVLAECERMAAGEP